MVHRRDSFGVFVLNNINDGIIAKTQFFPSSTINPTIPISTPLTFPFQKKRVLMVFDKNNWWNPLGGHIEENETWEQALIREAFEEGGVDISKNRIFGYIRVEKISGNCGVYPPITQIPMTRSVITKFHDNWTKMETSDRRFFSITEALTALSERGDNQQMLQIFSYLTKSL